jgi:hypothetical protein
MKTIAAFQCVGYDKKKYMCIYIYINDIYHNCVNPLNAELNPICHLLALLGAHPILHVCRIRVKLFVL